MMLLFREISLVCCLTNTMGYIAGIHMTYMLHCIIKIHPMSSTVFPYMATTHVQAIVMFIAPKISKKDISIGCLFIAVPTMLVYLWNLMVTLFASPVRTQ
eukprot:NODE_101_length_20473_cov_0.516590.p15 type:complete len:100 gc:universal NODE_101_length_20473_cov_0.516590:278-577(+)